MALGVTPGVCSVMARSLRALPRQVRSFGSRARGSLRIHVSSIFVARAPKVEAEGLGAPVPSLRLRREVSLYERNKCNSKTLYTRSYLRFEIIDLCPARGCGSGWNAA
jgi:hypothetical protein